MNRDEIKGKAEKAKGYVKDKAGEILNNPDLEAEGEPSAWRGRCAKGTARPSGRCGKASRTSPTKRNSSSGTAVACTRLRSLAYARERRRSGRRSLRDTIAHAAQPPRHQDLRSHRRGARRRLRRLHDLDGAARGRALVEQNKMAARRLTATLVASIEGAMLQERPDVTRTVLQELKTSTPVEGLTIFRRNGVEAFTDLTTAMEVDRNAGLAKDVLDNIKRMAREPGQTASGPQSLRAVETLDDAGIAGDARGRHLLHAALPDRQPGEVPGLSRQRPQGPRGGARGHVDGAGAGRGAQPS